MARVPKIEFKCENCGKPQPKNEYQSNKNWAVFDCNQKCECGGMFVMYVNGQKVGGGNNNGFKTNRIKRYS